MRVTMKKVMVVFGMAALGVVGCKSMNTSATTMPSTMPAPTTMAAPMTMTPPTTMPAAAAPATKDMTHVLEKEQPYFTSEPGPSATPAGMLAMGSKVLVIIPGAQYSQVMTDKGISAYTATDGLKPLGK